jgi:penicillin-binding protein 1A
MMVTSPSPRRPRDRSALDAVFPLLVGALLVGLCAALVIPAGALLTRALENPDVVEDRLRPLPERSTVYAADGSVIATLGRVDRVVIRDYAELPPVLINAVVAAEDRTYWTNGGVDVPAMARALVANVESGDIEQGGSTIAQQLVKNRILNGAKTVDRKAQELVLAYRLKHELGPERVVLEYLNTVYFGENSYGLATAAWRIVGKPLDQLSVADAALLAGSIRSPSRTNPFDHPDAALERRNQVIVAMVDAGSITRAQAADAIRSPLPQLAARPPADLRPTTYFVDEVQRQLLADPRLGATAEARERRLLEGGLQIHTTFDSHLQRVAEEAVRDIVPPSQFTASVAVMNPQTGDVLALVGGRDFRDAQYNLATQGARQPGSTFKMLTLATALENGYSPEDQIDGNAGCRFDIPGQPPWTPAGGGGGIMTLRDATVNSINCAYARLITGLGPDKVAAVAHAMGIAHPVPPVPSITLGSVEASPLEMATVASTIAADGVRHSPRFITGVTRSDGWPLFETTSPGVQAISPQTARTLVDVLKGVLDRGTGVRARIDRPAFGKTGSTDDNADAWFVGATPTLAAAVWMGDPGGRVPMTNVGGQVVFGGSYPALIWARLMAVGLAGAPAPDFAPPDPGLWPEPTFASEAGRGVMVPVSGGPVSDGQKPKGRRK